MYKKSILIIGMLLFGIIAPFAVAADEYEFPLAEGTGESEVKTYDEDAWEDFVGKATMPDDIWDGDADVVGAKSKSTIKSWEEDEVDYIDIIDILYDDKDVNDAVEAAETQIDAALDAAGVGNKYDVWMVTRDAWDFVEGDFDAEPDDEDDEFPIFMDPEDGEDILTEIQVVMYQLTYLMTFQMMYAALFPVFGDPKATIWADGNATLAGAAAIAELDGDWLFYFLVVDKGLPMAKPVDDYVEAVIDSLDCDDWEYDPETNVLIGETEGEDDYIIKVTLSDMGTGSKIEFAEDEDSDPFYVIEGGVAIPGYELSLLLAFSAAGAIGLIYIVMKKK
jgi:hypothetical protein